MVEQRHVGGLEYLALVSELLQAARQNSPTGGLWEAADLQWWWRKDQHPEPEAATFWLDAGKPVAALITTNWGDVLGLDILTVETGSADLLELVRPALEDVLDDARGSDVEMLIGELDHELTAIARGAGLVPTESVDETAWMDESARPPPTTIPDGYVLLSRDRVRDLPHHMVARNGDAVEARLSECSLYRPELDLVVFGSDGTVAGYGLFWADPLTGVGLVEPMRTEDAHQQRGIAGAVLTAGLHRLAAAGCTRFKVSYLPTNTAARRLYLGAGFVRTSTSRSWSSR